MTIWTEDNIEYLKENLDFNKYTKIVGMGI